ncbi:hypothetical protein GW916_00955 [bacterium]|nr:hypothetical protein [bacterium]
MTFFGRPLSIFGLLLALVFCFSSFGGGRDHSSDDNPSHTSDCSSYLQADSFSKAGLELPEILRTADGKESFVFRNFGHAIHFLKDGHRATKKDLPLRIRYLLPAVNGVWNLIQASKKEQIFSSGKQMSISSAILMWVNTLRQFSGDSYDERLLESLYDVIKRLADSKIFASIDHPPIFSTFNMLFDNLNRAPPEILALRWKQNLARVIDSSNKFPSHSKLILAAKLLDLTDEERAQIATAWLNQEATIELEERPVEMGHALLMLYEIDPSSAWTYFIRRRNSFLSLVTRDSGLLVRPLLYFKYVMGKNTPDLDQLARVSSLYKRKVVRSPLEDMIAQQLSEFGFHYSRNAFDPEASAIEMDFYLTLEDGRRVNIEVDGKAHFVTDEHGNKKQRLADRRRDEILTAQGIEVYRIPHWYLEDAHRATQEEELFQFLTSGKQ